MKVNRQWRLAARPQGLFKQSDFKLTQAPVAEPNEGEVLAQNLYLSLEPTYMVWAARDSYLPAVPIGEVMRGNTISMIEKSQHPNFREGDIVLGWLGWQDYGISDGTGLNPLPTDSGIPLPGYFNLLGVSGLAAYFGLLEVGKPKPGETLVVTAAAGAAGSLAGQIGKIKGCRVVGIAGSDTKCRWLTEELGFDAAINYKTENLSESLKRHCPDGIDIDFENVGGEILDAILGLINPHARIALCGLISQYTGDKPIPPLTNLGNLGIMRARIEGFIVSDYLDRVPAMASEVGQWLAEGKIKFRTEIVEGLEHAPLAVNKLFDGSHSGKLVVHVSDAVK